MRKLLALLGTVALTSSGVGILTDSVTMSKPTTTFKTQAKKMAAMSELTTSSDVETEANEFTATEISKLDQESQQWDDAKIDEILKQSLEYHDYQLSINKKKLDMKNLPSEVSEHLDEALIKLNEVVSQGVIQVEVENNKVELIYPDNNGIMKANTEDDDVFYYDDANTMRAESAYMWFTKYGPKPWWKIWKWGVYLHFSEAAVIGARIVNVILNYINFRSFSREMGDIQETIGKLNVAHMLGDDGEVNKGLKDLSKSLGGMSLEILGNLADILAYVGMALILVDALLDGTGMLKPIITVIMGIVEMITGKIANADKGKGVKWQLICFIIPGSFSAE